MKTKVLIFMLTLTISMVTACCDRRCSVQCQKQAEPINLQEKLTKMKEQAGDKGLK